MIRNFFVYYKCHLTETSAKFYTMIKGVRGSQDNDVNNLYKVFKAYSVFTVYKVCTLYQVCTVYKVYMLCKDNMIYKVYMVYKVFTTCKVYTLHELNTYGVLLFKSDYFGVKRTCKPAER